MGQRIIVSDVCDTLFFMNTSFDFVRYLFKKRHLSFSRRLIHLIFLSANSPFFWFLVAINKLSNKDFHRTIAVSLLKGYRREAVTIWAVDFLNHELLAKKNEQLFKLLENSSETRPILASASFDVIIAPIAEIFQAEYIATELEDSNGVLTGRIKFDSTGRKNEALFNKLNISLNEIDLAISDNHSDKVVLSTAKKAIAVCYKESDVAFWQKQRNDIQIMFVGR